MISKKVGFYVKTIDSIKWEVIFCCLFLFCQVFSELMSIISAVKAVVHFLGQLSFKSLSLLSFQKRLGKECILAGQLLGKI